ncbi:putative zinc alcohol dehydrogenase [Paraphoma chrysanthemicola]|uniref:Zinc alcohol dehydrogenase n=1 Tax=Paraphoma chrysanthemicola TaxID=798071 RepID=A0A8K0R639_9PLEO|nr:putative zinc alcohol dehydrogenase [Paraphoma chrysanthemicola]
MATMLGWLFQASSGPMEKNLTQPASGIPRPKIKDTEILVQNFSAGLNAIDYKVLELGFITNLVFKSITPGADLCGRVVETGSKVTEYKVDDVVYGCLPPAQTNGTLAHFVPVPASAVALVPKGLNPDDMVAIGTVGMTTYAALNPYVHAGTKVFINGGSGGTGVMAIQIAKILGAEVTTSSSASNLAFCKELGADTVLDYTSAPIAQQLKDSGAVFDLIVDNIGAPANLYRASTPFLRPEGKYVQIGLSTSLSGFKQFITNKLTSLFAWGKREWIFVDASKGQHEAFVQLAEWLAQGKLRTVIDSTFEFSEVPKAYERLKTGRAKGKVVVHVQEQ